MGWGSSFIWTAIRSSFSRDVPFFMIFFICTPTPAKDDGIPIGEFGRVFLQKKLKKILTHCTTFSKVPTKNEPFGFYLSMRSDKTLRIRIPVILRGGRGGGGAGEGGVDKNSKMKNPKPVSIQFPVEWTCLMIINKFQLL